VTRLTALFVLAALSSVSLAGPDRPNPGGGDASNPWRWADEGGGYWWRWRTTTTSAVAAPSPMDAVNQRRAQRGLPPFVEDPLLSQGAQAAAEYRAQRLMEGHTGNDFQFLPPGAQSHAAGCAAWPPHLGWGSCCSEDRATYAGAGWAMGADGRRYMHLFVR